MVRTYRCDGFRSIKLDDEQGDLAQAQMVFADRLAKREYGKRGYCRHCRLDNWAPGGSFGTWECFIGRSVKGGGTQGHNVWLTVYVEVA